MVNMCVLVRLTSVVSNATCHVMSMDASWLVRSQHVSEHMHSSITGVLPVSRVIHHIPGRSDSASVTLMLWAVSLWCTVLGEDRIAYHW